MRPCYTVGLPIDWLAPLWVRGYDAMLVTVVAHEWSHHVTHILGQIEHSEREELRADCHAGMFLAWSSTVVEDWQRVVHSAGIDG